MALTTKNSKEREKILAEIKRLEGDGTVYTKEFALGILLMFIRDLPAAEEPTRATERGRILAAYYAVTQTCYATTDIPRKGPELFIRREDAEEFAKQDPSHRRISGPCRLIDEAKIDELRKNFLLHLEDNPVRVLEMSVDVVRKLFDAAGLGRKDEP